MNNDQISKILMALLIVMVIVLFILIIVGIVITAKRKKNAPKMENSTNDERLERKSKIEQNYDVQSVFNFMEFDKIEDNMIVQKNGMRYLMVVQCQGVNYDLMSMEEKIGVEQGFIQFLNTLRHPIQIYIQTRTVNLEKSIATYRDRVKEYEMKLNRMKMEYQRMINSGNYSQEELDKYLFEITKQKNLTDYGKDVVSNTEKMSLNRGVLNKQYYIVIPYYSADINNGNLDKEEIKNMAFSELYTMAQSIIRTIGVTGVNGKILNSNELVDLLYVAYNRDEEEVYGLNKAVSAGYDELYSTSKNVLDKAMEALDKKIETEAVAMANLKIMEAKSEKEKMLEEKEDTLDLLIRDLAKSVIEQNKSYIGEDIAKTAQEKIQEEIDQESKKGEEKNVPEETKRKTRRVRKATKQ